MKLDESIELRNLQNNNEIKSITEMENIDINEMRSCMNEMLNNESTKDCMYEVLRMEGFLPESLEEGETYENIYELMMEDDDIMSEMYSACSMNESDCGTKIKEGIRDYALYKTQKALANKSVEEELHGDQDKIDANRDGEISAHDFEILRNKGSVDEDEKSEGSHYKNIITQIHTDLEEMLTTIQDSDELSPWVQDKLAVMHHSANAIITHLRGKGDSLSEEFKPVKGIKGINVDAENKSTADKENDDALKAAEKSQETEIEKVDNLKNQKHELNPGEMGIKDMAHGFRNNLDLDYSTGLSKEEKERILDLASGKAPEDHANVDHESKGGEKLINAAKERVKNGVNQDDYSSAHDVTSIEDNEVYKKTTAVSEELNRMKNIFSYEDKLTKENKTKNSNEDQLLFNSITKKTMI